MVKFVIVEKDLAMQNIIRDVVLKVAFSIRDFEIERYTTINDNLLKTIEDGALRKIYLLDVSLNSNVSGIQIAKKIRDVDWDSHIIFITEHDKMFEQVHRQVYEVFDFIEKFHDMEQRLEKDLSLILSKDFDKHFFKYENRKIELQLFFKDITYIYRDTTERKLVIHTTHNSYKVTMNLSEVLIHLDSRFRQVHRACIVNDERVDKYDWAKGEITLDTGEVIPYLSKNYKEELVCN